MKNLKTFNEHKSNQDLIKQHVVKELEKYNIEIEFLEKFSILHYRALVNGFLMDVYIDESSGDPTFAFISKGLGTTTPRLLNIIERDVLYKSASALAKMFRKDLPEYSSKKILPMTKHGILDID